MGLSFFIEIKYEIFTVSFEQHASVSWQEEIGLNAMGYNIVDVAQRMSLGYSANVGDLKVNSATNIFPSATLKVNNNQIMKYNQPSFEKTHKVGFGNTSYYPSVFFKR